MSADDDLRWRLDAALRFDGRCVLVTGAAQGIGRAIARAFHGAGAQVALLDVDAAVDDAAAALDAHLRSAWAARVDVRDESALQAAFDAAVARAGGVDVMVNCAALTPTTGLWDVDAREWDDVLQVNLRGTFLGCRIAGRHMRERRSGRIVNVSSAAAFVPSPVTGVHYAASKAGILAVTRAFAAALAASGVTVNAVAPSAIEGVHTADLEPARRDALMRSIPSGRLGRAEEVAAAVAFLASPAAAYVTGTTLDVTGGRLMR